MAGEGDTKSFVIQGIEVRPRKSFHLSFLFLLSSH